MRASFLAILATASGANAAYSGDIVQYWFDQTANLVNGTIIGSLQSPPSGWIQAIVTGSIYLAVVNSISNPHEFQQLTVSYAAHNSLTWVFHGTRNFAATDAAFKAILTPIGIAQNPTAYARAHTIGKKAAATVAAARLDDGFNGFADYTFGIKDPTVLGDINQFKVVQPPSIKDARYETDLFYVKAQGAVNSTVRTAFIKDTAFFWRESAPVVWNRLANAIIGNSLAKNVTPSAKFYAQLNYALNNAAIAAWNVKFTYNTWRPVTAIQSPGIWPGSGHNVSQANWLPLLSPTPSHQDYISTHSTFGGAAAAILRLHVGGDKINATISSNVTSDSRGVITRTYTGLTAASIEDGQSRVFGGLHFPFAAPACIKLGSDVALATLKIFDSHQSKF